MYYSSPCRCSCRCPRSFTLSILIPPLAFASPSTTSWPPCVGYEVRHGVVSSCMHIVPFFSPSPSPSSSFSIFCMPPSFDRTPRSCRTAMELRHNLPQRLSKYKDFIQINDFVWFLTIFSTYCYPVNSVFLLAFFSCTMGREAFGSQQEMQVSRLT